MIRTHPNITFFHFIRILDIHSHIRIRSPVGSILLTFSVVDAVLQTTSPIPESSKPPKDDISDTATLNTTVTVDSAAILDFMEDITVPIYSMVFVLVVLSMLSLKTTFSNDHRIHWT